MEIVRFPKFSVFKGSPVQRISSAPSAPSIFSPARPDHLEKAVSTMQIFFYVVIVIHVIVCFFLIGVGSVQQGRSARSGRCIRWPGIANRIWSARRRQRAHSLTTWGAVVLMCTSICLVVLFMRSTGSHWVFEEECTPPAYG